MSQCWGFIGERRMVGEGEGGSLEEKLRKPVILHKSKFWRQQDIAGNIEETLNHILRKYWRNRFSHIDPFFEGGQDIVGNILKYFKKAFEIFLFLLLRGQSSVCVSLSKFTGGCNLTGRTHYMQSLISPFTAKISITGPTLSLQKNE